MAPTTVFEKTVVERNSHASYLTMLNTIVNATTTVLDAASAAAFLDELNSRWEKFHESQTRILASEDDPDEVILHEGEGQQAWNMYMGMKMKLVSLVSPTTTTPTPSTSTKSQVSLPKITLPTFSGVLNDWISFRDMYVTAIHDNTNLSNAQKFTYLQTSLTGEALNIIKSFSITDANYVIAWDNVKKRYENNRELYMAIMKKFCSTSPVTAKDPNSVQTLVDSTNECSRALDALSVKDKWDSMQMFLVYQKMDAGSRQFWELTLKDTEIPTCQSLLDFLDQRARSLAASQEVQPEVQPQPVPKERSKKQQVFHVQPRSRRGGWKSKCPFCEERHPSFQCSTLKSKPVMERRDLVRDAGLCFVCLMSGHMSKECNKEYKCKSCGKTHHTLLHVTEDAAGTSSTAKVIVGHTQHEEGQTLLATAVIRVKDHAGVGMTFRALLDGGSTASFVSESCVKSLGLTRKKSNAEVVGLSATNLGKTKGLVRIEFESHFHRGSYSFGVEAYILPEVTSWLPQNRLDTSKWRHLSKLEPLADPHFHTPMEVDILLGADVFYHLLTSGKKTGPRGTPMAQNSKLGWLVGGSIGPSSSCLHVHHSHLQLEQTLEKFWEVEKMPSVRVLTPEEKKCEDHFLKTHRRDDTGRYVVSIPMKTPQVLLGSSRQMAVRRFLQVERRLKSQPAVWELYCEFMKKYQNLGHMVEVPVDVHAARNYLPHHYVLKDMDLLHKFRVVFDGSAKTSSGNSYNEAQIVGPTIQDPLVTIIMRFRVHPVAFTADIQKMFRQILVTPDDQDMQCIVWRSNANGPLQEFKLKTVTYGTSSAPFLATRVLKQLSVDEGVSFPLASPIMKNDFYVDDCMSGAKDPVEAQEIIRQLRGMTEAAGMSLAKFASNSADALKNVPVELRETQEILSMQEEDEIVKTLGLQWNTTTDQFLFKVKIENPDIALTKRSLLSQISRIFDPMGWLAPAIITTKILMQEVWKEKTGWDDSPSPHILHQWEEFKSTLKSLETLRISRCIAPSNTDELQLHGFSDASEKAYAAVVYVRAKSQNGEITISLVTAKSKVAPVKTISVPRLELCGALLLAELMQSTQDSLQFTFSDVKAWTDSTIVLGWIKSCPHDTFVANRITKIQDILPHSHWGHVSGVDNPADCASRGLQPHELVSHPLWWTGPRWLKDEFPVPPVIMPIYANLDDRVLDEQKTVLVVAKAMVIDSSLLSRFSSLLRLKRITAWCMRFFHALRQSVTKKKGDKKRTVSLSIEPLTADELESGLVLWLKLMQASTFFMEIESIRDGRPVPVKSKVLALNPFLDACGLLRVGGRLRNADVPMEKKTPILLPRHHRLTELVILDYHKKTLHGGTQLLQSVIGEKFWIVRAKDAIAHQVRKCIPCTRQRAATMTQLMGDLPKARVNPSRPFSKTGVDYAGPFLLRAIPGRSKVTFKAYIALFICFTTRAIHLEMVSSLSTEAFIAALRRFTGRRGNPSDLFSDCGTNSVGAAKELEALLNLVRTPAHNDAVTNHLSSDGIRWHFNPPGAPHFGGLWEAGVKSVKHHLYRVIGATRLTFEEMSTVLVQIEGCLNSRPLTPVSADPMDMSALTPAHFLIGGPMKNIPDPDLTELPINRLSRWQLVQQLQQHFWHRWSQEYLTRLQQRPKWLSQKVAIEINDMVLVKAEGLAPTKWPLARVIEIHPAADGLTRVVTLRTAEGITQRPIHKLCLLPVDKSSEDEKK